MIHRIQFLSCDVKSRRNQILCSKFVCFLIYIFYLQISSTMLIIAMYIYILQYAMPNYGTAESIQALSKDATKKFYNKWYIPTKMVQVVVVNQMTHRLMSISLQRKKSTKELQILVIFSVFPLQFQAHGVAERITSSFNTKSLSSEPQILKWDEPRLFAHVDTELIEVSKSTSFIC